MKESKKDIKLEDLYTALEIAINSCEEVAIFEKVSIYEALYRVLDEDIYCKKNMPAFDNSAMDGYVIKLSDAGTDLKVNSTIFAGDNASHIKVTQGSVYKIMTGAMVPEGGEAIVPIEDVIINDDKTIRLPNNIKENSHIRFKSSEVKVGDLILKKGEYLEPFHIASIASQGISVVRVKRKLRAALFSSGDEIIEPWEKAQEYQIYNSNSIGIYSNLKSMNIESFYLGALPDDRAKMLEVVKTLGEFDLIITSGGVSVGDADYTVEVFQDAGMEVIVHGIAAKPGKHGLFGKMGNTYILGLPGNPLSTMAMFLVYVSPIIAKLQGRRKFAPTTLIAKNDKEFSFKGKRANIIFGTVKDGKFYVTRDYKYSSGMLAPMLESNCFIVAQKGVEVIEKGAKVKVVLPFNFNAEQLEDFYTK